MTNAPGPLLGAHFDEVRKVRPKELAVRFGLGATISVVAGLVSLIWGPKAGGMFLAFPAILPATLTLIEKKENLGEARQDVSGAVLGGAGLFAFALTLRSALPRFVAPVALLLGLTCWLFVSVGVYLCVEGLRRRVSRR